LEAKEMPEPLFPPEWEDQMVLVSG